MEEDFNDNPNPSLFGRKLSSIPCFRSTYLYSSSAGLAATMGYFLFTSKMRKAIKFGLGVYASVTVTYWCYCRYNYSLKKFQYRQMGELLKRHQLGEMDKRISEEDLSALEKLSLSSDEER